MAIPTEKTHSLTQTRGGTPFQVGILHGASYVGRELIELLTQHPETGLATVTSRTFAGQSVSAAHPSLRGRVNLSFTAPNELDESALDALIVAGEHGQSMQLIPDLLATGFDGTIVDLSADFRYSDPELYRKWFDVDHPAPECLDEAVYGLPEWADGIESTSLVANPGCFATGISLALAPLSEQGVSFSARVTALTGASGSGAKPSSTTHFPDREGNVRPYKVLDHQHQPEIMQVVGEHVALDFVPASGPWTRGIWGTAHIEWPTAIPDDVVSGWFTEAYAEAPCVRCSTGSLPSLQPVVGTPFFDVGWETDGTTLVVGFALDNLLKGAASQAIQNLNRVLDLPETVGLLPQPVATAEDRPRQR